MKTTILIIIVIGIFVFGGYSFVTLTPEKLLNNPEGRLAIVFYLFWSCFTIVATKHCSDD